MSQSYTSVFEIQSWLFQFKWLSAYYRGDSKFYVDKHQAYPLKTNSKRYICFAEYDRKCSCCGRKGEVIRIERAVYGGSKRFHANLYIKDGEKFVLMTKYHKNKSESYRPLCLECKEETE